MKIISTMRLPLDIQTLIKTHGTLHVIKRKMLTQEDMQDCDVLIGNVEHSLVSCAKQLKLMQLNSAGSDTYAPLVSDDCILCNAAGTFGKSISEHLLMCTIMLFRNMPHYVKAQANHEYDPIYKIKTIEGSRFLVLGTGDLGTSYAQAIQSLGGYTIGIKRRKVTSVPYFDEIGYEEDIDRLLPTVDVVCMCLPKNQFSDHIMDARRIDLLNEEAIVLNVGRSNAIDTQYLCQCLNDKKVFGAALDVFDVEPIEKNDRIWETRNLIITPHVAGNFANDDTYQRFYDIVKENLERFFNGEELLNQVDKKLGY